MKRLLVVMLFTSVAARAQSDFPNWAERVVLEWINRARVDPQVEMNACGAACSERACYAATAPLMWSEQLNRSSRFHAAEMAKQQYFGHDSKCTVVNNIDLLFPSGCDGAASCGCVGGSATCAGPGCTPWYGRVGLFGAAPSGEIIAGTGDPNFAFYLWLNEPSTGSDCAFGTENGHRYLILTSAGAIGVGVTTQVVGDFGSGGTPYKIPSAAHYPQQAAAVDLWANWYDSAAPRSANAIVDGRCMPLTLRRGTPQNGAWTANVTNVGAGCHRYYFAFVDSSGATITYPATGSLGIGCADWDSSRVPASCGTVTSSRRRSARH
ncbi:MAG TPA: hypothetical protein VER58_01695 [Thermoanaerobaculia bacterium]|nr:hypothetical protein [Thermoanaerobaculia bacterium]